MKVISLLQPWASLVVLNYKKIETRSWNTKYRGPLLIHASAAKKQLYKDLTLDFHQQFSLPGMPNYKDLPFGSIIGQVDLMSTFQTNVLHRSNFENKTIEFSKQFWDLTNQELAFGDYTKDRHLWLLSNAVQFDEPLPVKGELSMWEYDLEKKQKVVKAKPVTNYLL